MSAKSSSLETLKTIFEKNVLESGHQPSTQKRAFWEAFVACGLPTRKDEAWKYTDISYLLNTNWETHSTETHETPDQLKQTQKTLKPDYQLIFVDGNYIPHLSTPFIPGVRVEQIHSNDSSFETILNQIPTKNDGMSTLHRALLTKITNIEVTDNTNIEKPIYIFHLGSQANYLNNTLLRVDIGRSSQIKLVSHFSSSLSSESSANYFNHYHMIIELADHSELSHALIQEEHVKTTHISDITIQQHKQSQYKQYQFDIGSELTRRTVKTALNGEGAMTELYGFYQPGNKQHIDNQVDVSHYVPNCHSKQLYKGLAKDSATVVFNGKIYIHPHAQHSQAEQTNKNLLLSDQAQINTKPQLEVYANQVKCTHGATTAQFDEDMIFYCQSRGLSEEQAKSLLIHAFAQEILDTVNIPGLKKYLEKRLAC